MPSRGRTSAGSGTAPTTRSSRSRRSECSERHPHARAPRASLAKEPSPRAEGQCKRHGQGPRGQDPAASGARRRRSRAPTGGSRRRRGARVNGASVVIVGGGIFGATTFWELAREDVDVLLVDAGRFGGGQTSKSGAIVRCHYSNPEVVRMAVRSREALRQLPLRLDCEPVYTRTGWLFLVEEDEVETAVANAAMQDEEGLDTVEPEDLQELLPGVNEDGIAYALYEPDSGYADPVATTRAYVDAGLRAGGVAR